jgi:flagellar hook-associated protein 3 FlgL
MNKLNERVTSGRSYQKASEDPATALKAYKVRISISRLNVYQSNLEEASGELTERESAVTEINSILSDINTEMLQATSDTYGEVDRKTFATALRSAQEQILNIGNSKFGSKYVFGGNDPSVMPFTVDASGNLLYHGYDVAEAGNFGEETYFFDVGLGIKTDAAGNVQEGTGLDMACPGSALLGVGTDPVTGVSNNLYTLLGQLADKLDANNMTEIKNYTDKLNEMTDKNLVMLSETGTKSNFIDFLTSRDKDSLLNAQKKQKSLEGIDSAKAILDFNNQENAYNAALAMGTKIMQYTILDYLR